MFIVSGIWHKVVFLFLIVLVIFGCHQENKKKAQGERPVDQQVIKSSSEVYDPQKEVIEAIVQAYINKDAKKINDLIHPELGLAIIFRPGVSDRFYLVEDFDFSKPVPEYYPYEEVKNEFELDYEALPEFDCRADKWSKSGLYCDSTQNPRQLSQIVEFEKEFNPAAFPSNYIQKIVDLESDSYRVILTGDNSLIFHIKKYNGKWYLTVFDRAYGVCDA